MARAGALASSAQPVQPRTGPSWHWLARFWSLCVVDRAEQNERIGRIGLQQSARKRHAMRPQLCLVFGFIQAATLVVVAALIACGSPATNYDVQEPIADLPTNGHSHEVVSRVIEWTLGSGATRAPPPRGRARLLLRTSDRPLDRARAVTTCVDAHAILPELDGKRVYLAVGGTIFVVSSDGREAAPTPLVMSKPHVRVVRLLAFERERQQSVILALVSSTTPAREAIWTLWMFRIQGTSASGERVDDEANFVDAAADSSVFYRRFYNPKCQTGQTECIVVTEYGDDTTVMIERKRGALPRDEIETLSQAGVYDAAWASETSTGDQWILRRCPEG